MLNNTELLYTIKNQHSDINKNKTWFYETLTLCYDKRTVLVVLHVRFQTSSRVKDHLLHNLLVRWQLTRQLMSWACIVNCCFNLGMTSCCLLVSRRMDLHVIRACGSTELLINCRHKHAHVICSEKAVFADNQHPVFSVYYSVMHVQGGCVGVRHNIFCVKQMVPYLNHFCGECDWIKNRMRLSSLPTRPFPGFCRKYYSHRFSIRLQEMDFACCPAQHFSFNCPSICGILVVLLIGLKSLVD